MKSFLYCRSPLLHRGGFQAKFAKIGGIETRFLEQFFIGFSKGLRKRFIHNLPVETDSIMQLRVWEPDLSSLRNRIEAGEINLQPDFQRNEVWNRAKKRKLIDTILRGWTIPPIHLIETAGTNLDVLDGQQRLTAIMDFYEGRIKIDGSILPNDHNIQKLDALRYSSLPVEAKRRFDRSTLRVVNIYDYRPDEPGELFYRLNEGIKLTPAEQRNALFGPIREQVKYLSQLFEEVGLTKERIGFSNSRMAYEDVLSRCIFALERGSIYSSFADNEISDRFRSVAAVEYDVYDATRESIIALGRLLNDVERVKLNKSTLFSLLLFFSYQNTRMEVDTPLAYELCLLSSSNIYDDHFRLHGELEIHANALKILSSVYRDRASLRVNDAASVVIRDICLWLWASIRCRVEAPTIVRREILYILEDSLKYRNEQRFLSLLDDKLLLRDWGMLF